DWSSDVCSSDLICLPSEGFGIYDLRFTSQVRYWCLELERRVNRESQIVNRDGCSGWGCTSTVPLNRRVDYCYPTEQHGLALPAGVAPAWVRLGDECLF